MQPDSSRDARGARAAAVIALLVALATAPLYWLLDEHGGLPIALRDRPWPLAVAALGLALLVAVRSSRTLRVLAAIVGLAAPLALGATAYVRYRLPATSTHAGLGKPLPDHTVTDDRGAAIALRALPSRPTVLVWFRGAWCPYCRKQLAELAAEATRYPPDAFSIVAVAADPPGPMAKMRADLHLAPTMTLLSDPDRHLVNICELGHCVAILDAKGVVRWAALSGNWEKQLPARALLQAAYRTR